MNLLALAVGALVGTLTAGDEEDVDVVGMFALALCFGFGGGLVRTPARTDPRRHQGLPTPKDPARTPKKKA